METSNVLEPSLLIWGLDPKIVAIGIVTICYLVIFSEKVNRAIMALLGAAAMIVSGILTQKTALAGIDFNTIGLLVGMMVIVAIAERSGMFQYVAIWGAKRVKASPRGLLVVLAFVTAVFSAFLDNVTTVLLIAPVTFRICQRLKLNPYPYLVLEIFASNIGGTATLIGDPPNILIGSSVGLSFNDFLLNLTPVVLVTMVVLVGIFDFVVGRKLTATEEDKAKVMKMNEKECIADKGLLVKSLVVLAGVITCFVSARQLDLDNGTIALTGAAVLMLLYTFKGNAEERDDKVRNALAAVDWTTIFFFIGLFVMVYGLEVTGILSYLGHEFIEMTNGSINKLIYLIFAILGLRALYFLLEAAVCRFVYLKQALSVILIFIGSKIFLPYLGWKIEPWHSLTITFSIIFIGIAASLLSSKCSKA
jgi:Na+/H+ antiporter NhaD/arsenite permease-like protein